LGHFLLEIAVRKTASRLFKFSGRIGTRAGQKATKPQSAGRNVFTGSPPAMRLSVTLAELDGHREPRQSGRRRRRKPGGPATRELLEVGTFTILILAIGLRIVGYTLVPGLPRTLSELLQAIRSLRAY
jgi:hypothetical protein